VRLARNREGRKFAVKTYLRASLSNEDRRKNLEREVAILASVQHPCLLGYQETIETEESVNIVTELFDSRSLSDYLRSECLKSLGEEESRAIMRQLVKGLVYLHGRDIVHRDLKL
jgi:serine/threonine protein kinase